RAGGRHLVVWLSTREVTASGATSSLGRPHEETRSLGGGGGHRVILRHDRPRAPASHPRPTDTRWRATKMHRQVAEGGRAGGGKVELSRGRHASRGSDL